MSLELVKKCISSMPEKLAKAQKEVRSAVDPHREDSRLACG